MEKNVEISMLCQIYGKMLTEKQYELLNDYYNNDLSLSEIAENNNITRQAVRDIIKKGENKLYELEENILFMDKILKQEIIIKEIKQEITKLEYSINNEGFDNMNSKEEKIKIIKSIETKLNDVL
ncbi:MAG: DNA-binding protein [Clostridiales bacterium]|nr:DNA-binding protein [Clostridiales bacterium]